MKKLCGTFLLILLAAAPDAFAEAMTPDGLAKRVGEVFAGYNDFWAWVTQVFQAADGRAAEYKGRVYYKRANKFRLNFGQPPFIVEATDGDIYWVYDEKAKTTEWTNLDRDTPVHPLLIVFAAGDQMVKMLDRYFNIISLKEVPFGEAKETVYELVLSLKPEHVKELREKGVNKLAPQDVPQTWSFWVDKTTFWPKRIQVDYTGGTKYIFDIGQLYPDVGLSDRLFTMPPKSEGVNIIKMKRP